MSKQNINRIHFSKFFLDNYEHIYYYVNVQMIILLFQKYIDDKIAIQLHRLLLVI